MTGFPEQEPDSACRAGRGDSHRGGSDGTLNLKQTRCLFGAALSGAGNLLGAIKFAKWFELGENDVVTTVLTDSMEMYGSRLEELNEDRGEFTEIDAAIAYHRYLLGESTDNMQELTYPDKKRIHNLKYYTWVEQQGKTYDEIQAQWYDPNYWSNARNKADEIDALIEEFNAKTGLLKTL